MKKLSVLLLLMVLSRQVQALEYGCALPTRELNATASKIVEKYSRQKRSLPESLVLNSDVSLNQAVGAPAPLVEGSIEGFYRPAQDDNYALTPLPFLTVPLDRDRHVVYVCAHYNSDPTKTHVTIYLMRGYRLEASNIGSFFGNTLRGPQLEVRPMSLVLVDIKQVRRNLLPVFRWIPVVDWGLALTDSFQRAVLNAVTDMARLGVERITVTPEGIELATGVDLERPNQVLVRKFIKFEN